MAEITVGGRPEWLLVEAKANVQELGSRCQAKGKDSRAQIEKALAATKARLGVAAERDWLNGYYQYCNRLVVLDLLNQHGQPARLLHIYFCGDDGRGQRDCPMDRAGWQAALTDQKTHVGVPTEHGLRDRIHELFLPVC